MKKRKFTLTIRQAVQKAEEDLRLENALVSELGNGIVSRVKSGETT